jgi:hypothetical protein
MALWSAKNAQTWRSLWIVAKVTGAFHGRKILLVQMDDDILVGSPIHGGESNSR